jgi:hypothetical protein
MWYYYFTFNASPTHYGGSMQNGFDDFDLGPQSDEVYYKHDYYTEAGYCTGDLNNKFADDGVYDDADEPEGSYDLSDDADALASAGWGTDEDYGYYGDEF